MKPASKNKGNVSRKKKTRGNRPKRGRAGGGGTTKFLVSITITEGVGKRAGKRAVGGGKGRFSRSRERLLTRMTVSVDAAGGRAPGRGVVEAFAAVGQGHRVRLMAKLLQGPASYRILQQASRLAAGPLYHHVNRLRLAGLVRSEGRGVYQLTPAGRRFILVAVAAGGLWKPR